MIPGYNEKIESQIQNDGQYIAPQYEKSTNLNQSSNFQSLHANVNINEISQPGQGGALDFEAGQGGNHYTNEQNEGLLQPLIINSSQNASQVNSKYQHQLLNFNQNNGQNIGQQAHYNVQAKVNAECFSNLQSQMSSTNTGESNFNNRYKRPKMQRSSSGFEQELGPEFNKNDVGQSFKNQQSAQLYQQQINQQNTSKIQNWNANQRNNSNFEKSNQLNNQQNIQNPNNYNFLNQGENGIKQKKAFNQTQSHANQIFLLNLENNPALIAQYKQQQFQSCLENKQENDQSAAESADWNHCKTDRGRNLNNNFFNPLGHNILQNNYFQQNTSKQITMINKPQKIINKASSITNGDQIMIKSDINCLTCKSEKTQLNRQLTIVVKNDKQQKEDDHTGIQDNIFKTQGESDLNSLQRNHQQFQTLQISNCVNCGNYIVVKHQESQRNSRTIYDYVDFGHLNKEQQSNSHLFSQAIKEHPKFSFRPDVNPLSVMSVLKKYQKINDNQLNTNQLLIMQSLAPNNKGIAKFDYNPNSKYLKHRRKTIKALFQVSERFGFNNETIHHSIQLFDAIFMQKCIQKDQKSDELQNQDAIESLREKYESCKGVISEQICTFIASVCLFISSKYLELKYPVVEDICELMQCPFTFDEFVEMEQGICSMFDWDLQIPTCIESLQSFFAQGVIFSTDQIGGKQQIGNQINSKLVENLSQICSASASHLEELLQKMKQICLTLLPNLLIYDAQLFMSEELVSPVHLALAIIIEGRRCLGIRPLFAEEFKWMAFGDLYKKAARYESSNYCKIGSDLIEREVQKVQIIVQKVQISLYQKNFEQEQQNKEKKEKFSLNVENNEQRDDLQNIQFHPSQNETLQSPQKNENLQALIGNQNEEDKNQHQIPKKLLSDILNQRKQEDIQRQWSDTNQIPKKQNEIHTAKSLHSTEPTTEAEKKLQNKNNYKEQQLKLHHLESLNTIEKIEEKGSEIEESNVEHNYPDEFKEGNQTVRPTCSNNDPLSYNNQQNIIRTEVQEEIRKQDIKPSFLKENQIKINLEALQKNSKLNQIKIQPLRIQFQNNQNGLATVRNIIINKSAYESQKEGVNQKIQDNLDPKQHLQLNIKKDQNTKSLNTLGSSNYSYQNAYSDDINNQQSFQNNIFHQDLKSHKNNTFINVLNANENKQIIEDGQLKQQKYTQLYNTVIDPANQNNTNYLQVPSQHQNDNLQKIQNQSQKNKSQQSISSKEVSIQSRTKSNWSNPDNNEVAAPFKLSRQSQPQPMSVKPQLSKPRPSSNSINIQQQFNSIQVAIKSPKAKAKQSSSVTSVGGPIVSQKPPQCNLKIQKNTLKTNLLPSNQTKIVLKGKKQINNRKESVGGSISSRDSDLYNAAMNSLRQIRVDAGQAMYGANLGNIQQQDRLATEISNHGEIKQPSSYNMSTSTERASQQYLNENIGFIKNNQKLQQANQKGMKAITHRVNEQSNVFQYQSNPKVSQQKLQAQILGRVQGPRANGNQTIRKGLQSSHQITAEQNSSVGRTVIGPKMQNEKMNEKKSNLVKNNTNTSQLKKGEIEQFLNTDFKKTLENQHQKNLSKHSDWAMQANLNHHYNSVQQDIANGQKQYNSITESKQNVLESSTITAVNDKTHGMLKQNLNQIIISQKIDTILDDNRSNCTAATAPNPISSNNINFISASLISRNTDFKQPITARGITSNYYSLNHNQQTINNPQQKGLPPKMQKCSTSIGIIPTNASSNSGMNQDKKENNLISSQKIQLNIAKKHQATNQLQAKLPLKIDFDDIGIHKLNRNSNIQTQMNKTSSKLILGQQIKSGTNGQQQKPPIIHKVPLSSQPNASTANHNKQDYSQIYLLTAEDNVPSRNNNLINNQASQGKQIFQTMQQFQQSAQLQLQNQLRNQIHDNLNIHNYLQQNTNGPQHNPEKLQIKESHSKQHFNLNQQMMKQDQHKKIQGSQTSRNLNSQNGMSLIDSWKQKANNQIEVSMQGLISQQTLNQKQNEEKTICSQNGNIKIGVQNGMMSQLKLLQNIQHQQNRKQSVESQNGAKSQSSIMQGPQKQVVKNKGLQSKITPQFLLNR